MKITVKECNVMEQWKVADDGSKGLMEAGACVKNLTRKCECGGTLLVAVNTEKDQRGVGENYQGGPLCSGGQGGALSHGGEWEMVMGVGFGVIIV
jgi:hypothetical protein